MPRRHGGWSNVSALLWHTIWDASYTFLHIPKAAGSTLLKQDRYSADAAYTLMNQHAGGELRKREGTFRSRCRGTASPRHQCMWRHFSPRLLDACGFPEDINPYKKRSVYCAMREPRARFLSSFFYSERVAERGGGAVQAAQSALRTSPDQPDCQFGWHAFMRWSFHTNCWNASTYGAPDTPLNRWRFALKLRCFAAYAGHVNQRLKNFEARQVSELSKPRRGMRAFDLCDSHLHVQSQANYLADAAGEPTCHRVFSTEVAVAIDMRTNSAGPSSWQSALGKRMLSRPMSRITNVCRYKRMSTKSTRTTWPCGKGSRATRHRRHATKCSAQRRRSWSPPRRRSPLSRSLRAA